MSLGLETIVGVDRRHVVPAPLLLPSFAHADYTREARQRRADRRRRYHAGRARSAARGHHRPRPPGDDSGWCRHPGGPRLRTLTVTSSSTSIGSGATSRPSAATSATDREPRDRRGERTQTAVPDRCPRVPRPRRRAAVHAGGQHGYRAGAARRDHRRAAQAQHSAYLRASQPNRRLPSRGPDVAAGFSSRPAGQSPRAEPRGWIRWRRCAEE